MYVSRWQILHVPFMAILPINSVLLALLAPTGKLQRVIL